MKILVHAHVYYLELYPELVACISSLQRCVGADSVDVVITTPHPVEAIPLGELKILAIVQTPNRGYDIAPFLVEVVNRFDPGAYDCVVKIHTKRDTEPYWINYRPLRGAAWRRALLSFCSSPEAATRMVRSFERNRRVGMIAGARLINYEATDCRQLVPDIRQTLKDLGLPVRRTATVLGTMFAVRAELLQPLRGRYSYEDFPLVSDSNVHRDMGIAAVLEHVFPSLVFSQGCILVSGTEWVLLDRIRLVLAGWFFLLLRVLSNCWRRINPPLMCPASTVRNQ